MWVYVQLPSLQLDRMLALQPELAERALVLYCEEQQRVIQCNDIAANMGIRPSSSLSDAWLLAEDLAPYRYREAQQRHLLQHLAADLYQVFAVISLDPPNGLWLDLKPMQKLYPDIRQSQEQLQLQLAPWQVRYHCGVGNTPPVAKMLAQSGVETVGDIPIQYLPCDAKLQAQLIRMGLNTLGALQAIPRALAGQRLGKELVHLLARIQGEQHESLRYFQPPLWFYQRLTLLAETSGWQALRFPLKRLLQELEHYLEGRQQETRYLLLTFYHRDIEPTKLEIGLAHGGYLAAELAVFCQLKMESLKLPAAVLEMSIQAKRLQPRSKEHGDLLNGGKKQRKSLPRLLNELQLRLGYSRVFGVQNRHDWLPERAWQRSAAGSAIHTTHVLGRPLWLLPTPKPVQIQQWCLLRGPERYQPPWWQLAAGDTPYLSAPNAMQNCMNSSMQRSMKESTQEPMANSWGEYTSAVIQGLGHRDYWVARNQRGQPGWLFYDYQQECWWLHGWFS